MRFYGNGIGICVYSIYIVSVYYTSESKKTLREKRKEGIMFSKRN